MGRFLTTAAMGAALAMLAFAPARAWQAEKVDAANYPPEIVVESRAAAADGLPDGLIATSSGTVAQAWYGNPTRRYDHGVLGDAIEAGSLHVRLGNGRTARLILPHTEVFEDRAPRLADLDGNGTTEIITIRSSLAKGASVTVYGIENGAIVEKATTGFYGRKHRWLNIAAIAPFLGIAGNEIAFVATPHLGGTLFVMRYARGTLVQVAAGRDFSNHVIGSRELRLSAVADVDADGRMELALPSADRTALRIVGAAAGKAAAIQGGNTTIVLPPGAVEQGGLREIARIGLPAAIDKAIGIETEGRKGFVVGLENGEVYLIHP
ncbi:MAG: hypothetical protein KDJ80_10175 [Nitratireductor sp.]|nr:hypothetical protein [Nitratireductor sp.]